MLTTIIAVLGTLLGSVVSVLLSHRAERAVRADARADQRHADQVEAVTTLAEAVSAHRLSMWVAADARLAGACDDRREATQAECHRTRTAITAPAVRLRLLIRDRAVRDAATAAIQATYAMREATDPAALETARRVALARHDTLIETAAQYLS